MKVVGSVKPEEVPDLPKANKGVWTSLALKAIEAHRRGEVLVVTCANRDEYKRMRNGMAEKIRLAGYARSFTAVNAEEPEDGVRVYLGLLDKAPGRNGSVAPPNLRRPRKKQSA